MRIAAARAPWQTARWWKNSGMAAPEMGRIIDASVIRSAQKCPREKSGTSVTARQNPKKKFCGV